MGAVYEEKFNEFFQHQKKKDARLSRAHGNQRGTTGSEPAACQGQEKTGRLVAMERTLCSCKGSCGHGSKYFSPGRKDSQETGIFVNISTGDADSGTPLHHRRSEKRAGIRESRNNG
jgi:hypothetical protein